MPVILSMLTSYVDYCFKVGIVIIRISWPGNYGGLMLSFQTLP